MLLSQTAEYALRAVVWLASYSPDEPVRASELSEKTGIPVHYLSKILRRLVLAGLLTSQKGHGGGFRFAHPLGEICLRDVLVAVDAYPATDRCAFGWGDCNAKSPCPMHHTWSQLIDSVDEWACETTLADLGPPPRANRARRPGGVERAADD